MVLMLIVYPCRGIRKVWVPAGDQRISATGDLSSKPLVGAVAEPTALTDRSDHPAETKPLVISAVQPIQESQRCVYASAAARLAGAMTICRNWAAPHTAQNLPL
jgi:hypothetical protein